MPGTSGSMPGMPMPASGPLVPLDPSQFDLKNETQASDFLGQLLDDHILKYDAQKFSRNFWYGIVVFIALCASYNVLWRSTLGLR